MMIDPKKQKYHIKRQSHDCLFMILNGGSNPV